MIHELRRYVIAPGRLADYLVAARTIGREIRRDDYGKLEGHWLCLSGNLDQIVHLWSFADMPERDRLRAALGTNARWESEFLSLLEPLVLVQDSQLMRAIGTVLPISNDPDRIYELRTDRARVPLAASRLRAIVDAIPMKHGTQLGIWQTTVGRLNELVQLWMYTDARQALTARTTLLHDAPWQNLRRAQLAESSAQLLTPSGMLGV